MTDTATSHPGSSDAPRKGWTLAIASFGLFMVALDTLVVTTALPVLRVDLGASLADLEWTVNVYNLSFACFLLTGAALGDRFGRRGGCLRSACLCSLLRRQRRRFRRALAH